MIATLINGSLTGQITSDTTTDPIDTTGGDLIVICVSYVGGVPTISADSKGNTYTWGTERASGGGIYTRHAYKYNATVGTGHTFSFDLTGSMYVSYNVLVFSGALTASDPFDQEAGNTVGGGVQTIDITNITPTDDRQLIVLSVTSALAAAGTTIDRHGFTVEAISCSDSSFTEVAELDHGPTWGLYTAYKVQGTAAAVGPTITQHSNFTTGNMTAAISSFKTKTTGPTQLDFTTQPSNAASTAAFSTQPVVTVKDSGGSTDTSFTGNVTIALGSNPGSGTLSGTTTVAAVAGVATFSGLSIDKAGTGYTLVASSPGLTEDTSSTFNITVGTATKLGFTTQPSLYTNEATAFSSQPVVAIQDAGGNTVTSSSVSVTVGIYTNTGNGTLSGTTTISASSGVATFSGLSINNASDGYVLQAVSSGLTSAVSQAFTIVDPAGLDSLEFDSFSTGTIEGAWTFYADFGGNTQLSIETEEESKHGPYVLRTRCTQIGGGSVPYDVYLDRSPWNSGVGDSYFINRSVDEASYTTGNFHVQEFYVKTTAQYDTPVTANGASGSASQFSGGSYTMAPSELNGGNQEAGGFHGYHPLRAPYTNDRWMKMKLMRFAGFRAGATMPCARVVRNTTNGVDFIPYETINCTPSGATLKFTWEGTHYTENCVFGLTTERDVIPATGDTLTGADSGAVRTVAATAIHLNSMLYRPKGGGLVSDPLDHFNDVVDAAGWWCNYDTRWIKGGGGTHEWFGDYPSIAYWDRVTRFYWAFYKGGLSVPLDHYISNIRLVADDRDDQKYISNLCAFFDPSVNKLYVHWAANVNLLGKTWEVVTAYSDIHDLGFDNATPWQTIADGGVYSQPALYETLNGTAGRPLYIGIRPDDQTAFTQIQIDTAVSQNIDAGTPVGGALGRNRIRRNM